MDIDSDQLKAENQVWLTDKDEQFFTCEFLAASDISPLVEK